MINAKPMKAIEHKELDPEEQKQLFNKICDDIIQKTNEYRTMFNERENLEGVLMFNYDLTDIGDFIGKLLVKTLAKTRKI